MPNYKEHFFNSKIKNITTFVKQKQNDLIHIITGEDNKYITPYFKHKIDIIENNKVKNIVNIFNQSLEKKINILKSDTDIVDQELLKLTETGITTFKGLSEREEELKKKLNKQLGPLLGRKPEKVTAIKEQLAKLKLLATKERQIPISIKAILKIEETPKVVDANLLKKIIDKEKQYIESVTTPRHLEKKALNKVLSGYPRYGRQNLIEELKAEQTRFLSLNLENSVRQDINYIRKLAINKHKLPFIGQTFVNMNNTEEFNKLLIENKEFAKSYLNLLRNESNIVIHRIKNKNLEYRRKFGIESPNDIRYNIFQQTRGDFVNPESIYKNNIYQPTSKKLPKVNYDKFGIQTIPIESIEHHVSEFKKEANWFVKEGHITKPTIKKINMGGGISGTKISFNVIKNGKNNHLDLIVPKTVNGKFRWSVGGVNWMTGLIGVRTAPNVQSVYDGSTMAMSNLTAHLEKIIEETDKGGTKAGLTFWDKIKKRHLDPTKATGDISDNAKIGGFVFNNIKKAITGGRGFMTNLEKNRNAAKAMINIAKAKQMGAWYVSFDIETITDDASTGSQVIKNKAGVWNIGVSIFDDKGKRVDFVNLYHDPSYKVDIRNPESVKIIDGLLGKGTAKEVENKVTRHGISKQEINRKINNMLKKRLKGKPYFLVNYNGTGFDTPILLDFFKGLEGGEFVRKLQNQALNIDLEPVMWHLKGEVQTHKLAALVRQAKGQDEYRAYRIKEGKDILNLGKKLGKKDMSLNIGAVEHTAIFDTGLNMQLLRSDLNKYNLPEAESLYDKFNYLYRQGNLNEKEKVRLMRSLQSSPHFIGAQGASRMIEQVLSFGALSPNRGSKGYGTNFDMQRYLPFGIFNSLDRQREQILNGVHIESWKKDEIKAYRKKYGFSPFSPIFSTEYAEGWKQATEAEYYSKYKIKRENAAVMNVFYPITKNAQTLEETHLMSKSIANAFKFQEAHDVKIDFDMPMVTANIDATVFHENIFEFQRIKYRILKHLKVKHPGILPDERYKIAVERARKSLSKRGLKIKAGEQFLRAGIRANGKTKHINKTGYDFDIMDANLIPDSNVHIVDGNEFQVNKGIVLNLQWSRGLQDGDKQLINTGNKGTLAITENMFTRVKSHTKGGIRKVLLGTEVSAAKFLKKGDIGSYFQTFLGNAIWYDTVENGGKNIKEIERILNITLKKNMGTWNISNAGKQINQMMLAGNFKMESFSKVFRKVGLIYAKGESENIKEILMIGKDIDIKNITIEIENAVKRSLENTKLIDIGSKFKSPHEACEKISSDLIEPLIQLKESGAKYLYKNENTNAIGFTGFGIESKFEDPIRAGVGVTKHDIRLSAIERMKSRLYGTEKSDVLETLFTRATNGEQKKNLKTLINLDFVTKEFLGIKGKSKFASKVNKLDKKQVMSMIDKFQKTTFDGHTLNELTKEHTEKFYNQSISDLQFKEFINELKTGINKNKTVKDLSGTFFDKNLRGDVFEIDLGRNIEIDVRDTLKKVSGRSDITDSLENEWDSFAKEFGIKDKIRISRKQYIVNPERFLTERADDTLYRKSGHMLQFSNFQNKLKAYWEKQNDPIKAADLALELVRMNMYNFNSEMRKNDGLFGRATESHIKGFYSKIVTAFNEETLRSIKESKTGTWKFFHNSMTPEQFSVFRKYMPKGMSKVINDSFETTKNTVGGNLDFMDWLSKEFAPGKRALPIIPEAYPAEMNKPMTPILYNIIKRDRQGLRPNDTKLPINPIIAATLQRDFDGEGVGAAWHGEIKSINDLDRLNKTVEERYLKRMPDGRVLIRDEYKKPGTPENVVEYINSKKIRIGTKNERLWIDEDGTVRVIKFDGKADYVLTDMIEDDRLVRSFGFNELTYEGKLKFIREQQNRALNQIFSKQMIPQATTKALREPINTLLYLARNGDETTLKKLFDKDGMKFNKHVVNLFDDLRAFTQDIIDLKSIKSKSEDLIEQKLLDLESFEVLRNPAVRERLQARGFFKETYDLLMETMDYHKELRKNISYRNQRAAIMGKAGTTQMGLARIMGGEPSMLDLAFSDIDQLTGFAGIRRPQISKQMQQGFWQKFERTYGKEKLGQLKNIGKYTAIGALIYGGLNFFRPNQLSNKYNPLDLFVDLGPQEGFGGEKYDYFSKNYGLGRFTPLDIPQAEFNEKTRIVLDDPAAEEKRETKALMMLEELLNREDLGMVSIPVKKQVNYSYNNKLSRINRLTMNDYMKRSGAIFK